MSSLDRKKLMEFEKVNEQRARRLLKDFGSYEAVMDATYEQLLETHYIGEKTARSIYYGDTINPNSLLLGISEDIR